MKIAHFSDLHFCNKNLEESHRCFSAGIELAAQRGARLAVISGDLLDHRLSANDSALHGLITNIVRLAYLMPVFILQGTYSHDALGTLRLFRKLRTKYPIYVADKDAEQVVLTSDELAPMFHPAGSEPVRELSESMVVISALPPYNKAQAAAISSGDSEQIAAMEIRDIMQGFAAINIAAYDAGAPRVLVSHGTMVGSITEHGVPMAGSDHEFTTELLGTAGTNMVMLGHIHKHQTWQIDTDLERKYIAYAGSIGRFHEGEEPGKGFLLWDTESKGPPELVETPASVSVAIEFDGPPDMDDLIRLDMENGPNCGRISVRVRYHVDEEHRSYVIHKDIESLFADYYRLKIEPIISPVIRSRAEGFSLATSMRDKIAAYANIIDADPEDICDRFEHLNRHDSADQIIKEVVQYETN